MSGFENYGHELVELDHEIAHYAAICGVDLADHAAVHYCINAPHGNTPEDRVRETLKGLLILRIKVETEMINNGMTPSTLKGW